MINLKYVNLMVHHELNQFTYINGEHVEYVVVGIDGSDAVLSAKFDKGELIDTQHDGLPSVVDIDEFDEYLGKLEDTYQFLLEYDQSAATNDNSYRG